MNTVDLALDDIEVGDRLRGLNGEYVEGLAASMDAVGQLTPIEVCAAGPDGKHRLVFGLHRLAGARLLGWTKLKAIIFQGSENDARLREIDENLVRRELSALDRATFLAVRAELWAKMAHATGRKASALARWHAMDTMSFASDASEKLGVSEKTVRRWLRLARITARLDPAVRAQIAGTRLADKPALLTALAGVQADMQSDALALLLAGEASTVKTAVDRLLGRLPQHETLAHADFSAFVGRWAKYSAETRRRIAEFVAAEMKARPKFKQASKA